jgi:predicted PurR-regulated permease PerM
VASDRDRLRPNDETPPSRSPQGWDVAAIWRTFFRFVLLVAVIVVLWQALPVLLLLFAGTLIALAVRFLSDNLSSLIKVPPRLSLTIVLVLLAGVVVAAGILMAPAVAEQMAELAESLRESLIALQQWLEDQNLGQYVFGWLEDLENDGNMTEVWMEIAGVFATSFSAIGAFALTLIVGVFLAYSPELYSTGLLRLIPIPRRPRAAHILKELAHTLRQWLVGQLISMAILAISTWLMLWLLGVRLAIALALLTGILTFIPYLGPLIAAVPILLIAFVESPTLGLIVLILYMVIQTVEGSVVMPMVFRRTVHLPPVLTIISQVLLGAMFGIVGVILATPLMAAGLSLAKMVYVEDTLGDSFEQPVIREASAD